MTIHFDSPGRWRDGSRAASTQCAAPRRADSPGTHVRPPATASGPRPRPPAASAAARADRAAARCARMGAKAGAIDSGPNSSSPFRGQGGADRAMTASDAGVVDRRHPVPCDSAMAALPRPFAGAEDNSMTPVISRVYDIDDGRRLRRASKRRRLRNLMALRDPPAALAAAGGSSRPASRDALARPDGQDLVRRYLVGDEARKLRAPISCANTP